jgi:hypothetical protein
MPNSKSDILSSFRERENLKKDKHFFNYDIKKQKIVDKCGDDWKLKTKLVAELLFKPNGDFQKFLWENMSEHDRLIQERKATGKTRKTLY